MKKFLLLFSLCLAFASVDAQLLATKQTVVNASDSIFVNINDIAYIQDRSTQNCALIHPQRLRKTIVNQYYSELDSTIMADNFVTFIDSDSGDTIAVNKFYVKDITMVPVDSTAQIRLNEKLFKKFISTETFYAIKNGL